MKGHMPHLSETIELDPSRLSGLFNLQKNLNSVIGGGLKSKDTKSLLNLVMAAQMELAEVVDRLDWKWWAKKKTDWDGVKSELIDVLHFWLSMAIISGMDAKEVSERFKFKYELNLKRAKLGYKDGKYNVKNDPLYKPKKNV